MLRYMPMGTGPSEARRGFGSSVAGVIDSWEPSVMLGTELGSSGKAVCALNHQVVYLAPGTGCFFCMPNSPFALQGMGQGASWMIIPFLYCLTCHRGFPWKKQRKTWEIQVVMASFETEWHRVFPISGTFLRASLLCVLATDQTSCPPHLWVIETFVCFVFVLNSWNLKQSFTMTGFPRCSNFLTVHLVRA